MLFVDPKKIKFETMGDIVDYVSKGFAPPTKKNFHEVIFKVNMPDSQDDVEGKIGNEVVITDDIVSPENRDCLAIALQKVYANRVRNRNIAIGAIAGTAGLVLLAMILGGGSKKTEPEKETGTTYILEGDNGEMIRLTEF